LIVLGLAFVVAALAVVVALRSLTRSVEELRTEIAGAATVEDLRAALAEIPDPPDDGEPERPLTRVPTMLRSPGVIKAMALGTGTASAARRLRGGSNGNGNGKGH
jgi:hypothetical protein